MHDKMVEMLGQEEADQLPVAVVSNSGEDGRRRRQATDTKYLEVRVMADRDMSVYYGEDVVTYVLTLMNVVSKNIPVI